MVAFSVATADQLISAAKNTAGKLRAQGPIREHLMTQALEDFSGGYARAFTQNCVAESEARGRLAGVLEDLVPQLQEAKWQYEQEQSRQANLAAWWDRETAQSSVLLFPPEEFWSHGSQTVSRPHRAIPDSFRI